MNAVAAALAKAQSEFGPIHRDRTVTVQTRTGGKYTFSYAPLEAILRATLPALNKSGFSLTQKVDGDQLTTTLLHEAGELSNSIRIIAKEDGPQAYGSALTYARRYGVTLLLGICADDDDDANAAEGNTATQVPKPMSVTEIVLEGEDKPTPEQRMAAEKVVQRMREAMTLGVDGAIFEIDKELSNEQNRVVTLLAWQTMQAKERRAWKDAVSRGRPKNGGA